MLLHTISKKKKRLVFFSQIGGLSQLTVQPQWFQDGGIGLCKAGGCPLTVTSHSNKFLDYLDCHIFAL